MSPKNPVCSERVPVYANIEEAKIAVIGLGYVGLPLALEFGKKRPTLGFDIDEKRVSNLEAGFDSTNEVESEELKRCPGLRFSNSVEDLREADVYIVTVPTPIDSTKRPNLNPLISASEMLGAVVSQGNLVVFESTVFPGATEEICVPKIESVSGLVYNKDFYVGYSPERINPGDKEHRLPSIKKVTSGSTPEIADYVDALYGSIIDAGTFRAASIRVAEAAKVIENTQRDLNIALINELAIIFNRLEIDTSDVLEAAETKWNFVKFKPGLVGGHCIGVDPYYLTHKAQEVGYTPEVILAGRRINDGMGAYIASQIVKLMLKKKIHINGARILMLGLTFKENCPDLRNTRVVNLIYELKEYGSHVDVCDPWADPIEAGEEYGIQVVKSPNKNSYDAVVLAVSHKEFESFTDDELKLFGKKQVVIYDIKGLLSREIVDGRL